jgi:hypothetical protein
MESAKIPALLDQLYPEKYFVKFRHKAVFWRAFFATSGRSRIDN